MQFRLFWRAAFGICLAALLAACESQSIGPKVLPGEATTQGPASETPGSNGDLLYVVLGHYLSIYSFPDLRRIKIAHTPFLGMGHSNPNNGDMCFANLRTVRVIKHGATHPYATIKKPPSSPVSVDCAFDPTTDDLAITYDKYLGQRYVAIYSEPYDGSPTIHADTGMKAVKYAAYDADGDLFVDGQRVDGCECLLDELPKGSSELHPF